MENQSLFEIDEFECGKIGRDIRKMTPAEIDAAGLDRMSRGDAIRKKCLDCSLTGTEVRRCVSTNCALWPFRFGTDPFREKRELTDEQKDVVRERFAMARKSRGAKE